MAVPNHDTERAAARLHLLRPQDGAELAKRLQEDLTNEDVDPWLDIQRLIPGDVWSREIEEAADQAGVVLALLSEGHTPQTSAASS